MKKQILIRKRVTRVGEHRKLPNKKVIGIYLDDDIPKKFHKSIIYHEKVEDKLQRKHGLNYAKAHRIATKLEKEKFFKNKPKLWAEQQLIVNKIYRENKRK